MSFLYFDRNSPSVFTTNLPEDGVDEEARAANELDEGEVSLVASTFQSREDDEVSFASCSNGSFSLSDPEVVTGFRPGTLMDIYRHGHFQEGDGETIVSSAPSDEDHLFPPTLILPEPQQQQQQVNSIIMTPSSHFESVLSMSTTESEYRNLGSLESSVASTNTARSAGDLSFTSLDLSSLPPSIIHSTDNDSCSDVTMALHEGTTFRNIANRLALGGNSHMSNRRSEWFSRFTEQDWIDFRLTAEMILQALEHPSSHLALPPPVPTFTGERAANASLPFGQQHASNGDWTNYLPEAFLCYLCQGPIVGALTLSCGCEKSTLCTECWEEYATPIIETEDADIVQVETRFECPSCLVSVTSTVSCHALDVAVFHTIKNVPEPLQHTYFARLDAWRKEILRRRQESDEQTDTTKDMILAELIQREEEMIWKKGSNARREAKCFQGALLFLGEMTACVAIASISAIGINLLARRN